MNYFINGVRASSVTPHSFMARRRKLYCPVRLENSSFRNGFSLVYARSLSLLTVLLFKSKLSVTVDVLLRSRLSPNVMILTRELNAGGGAQQNERTDPSSSDFHKQEYSTGDSPHLGISISSLLLFGFICILLMCVPEL
jgi:hypothetical protein